MEFCLYVLTSDPAIDLAALLSPFQSSRQVAEYRLTCACYGRLTYSQASQKAWQAVGYQPKTRLSDSQQAEWQRVRQQALEEQPLLGDPACPLCSGLGYTLSTANPDGHWQRWHIGGRWNGQLSGHRLPNRAGVLADNLAASHAQLALPSAVLTEQGEWIEVDPDDEAHIRQLYSIYAFVIGIACST